MKKFTLSADFVKWDPADENSSEPDSFDYVIDLESEEEARVRLDALIIERMSSKPGWSYKLVNSSLGEFPVSDDAEGVKVIYDLPVLAPQNDAPDVSTVMPVDVPLELLQPESENQTATIDPDQPV